MQDLEDEEKFKQYFTLLPAQFNETLSLIKQDIKKQDEYIYIYIYIYIYTSVVMS